MFLTTGVYSQIGLKGGVGVSDIVFADEGQTPYLDYEVNSLVHKLPSLSYQIGAFGTIRISNRFDFQPELFYARRGLNYDLEFLYDDITYRVKINYLQTPLLFKYKAMPDRKWHFGLFAGPYFSLKLNAVKYTIIDGQKNKTTLTSVKNTDAGIVAGFSFDFDLVKGQLVTDFRISYSLINMMSHIDGYIPKYSGPENERARNVDISILIGYQFQDLW